ncbi:hypothetical protein F4809DRAFT_639670 [Biscogniauxia mediterranea]|nr:hypothetical protein F4809DRAFT_639670 [Biscogniauxia mediterranea]
MTSNRSLADFEQRSVRHLEEVADRYMTPMRYQDCYWHFPNRRVALSAQDVSHLLRNCSRSSTQDPNDYRINNFRQHYQVDASQDIERLPIEEVLRNYFRRLDRLFFFNLIGRQIRDANGQVRPLISLQVKDITNAEARGSFIQGNSTIQVYTREDDGRRSYLQSLIGTMAHEMVHAYLAVFSDELDDRYDRWVSANQNHGEMFWEINAYILDKLVFWLNGAGLLEADRNQAHQELRQARRQARFAPR